MGEIVRRLQAGLLAGLFASVLFAAPAPEPVRAEINTLLTRLQASGCEFNRNGSWHSAADARTHLMRKLEHIERRTTLRNTEQFIALAATSSSVSGRAYQVRCQGSVQPSAQWLSQELASIRSSAAR